MDSQNETPRPTTRELRHQVRKLEKQVANLKIKLAEERGEKRALRRTAQPKAPRASLADRRAALREHLLAGRQADPAQPLLQPWFALDTPAARLAAIDAKMTREQPLASSRPR